MSRMSKDNAEKKRFSLSSTLSSAMIRAEKSRFTPVSSSKTERFDTTSIKNAIKKVRERSAPDRCFKILIVIDLSRSTTTIWYGPSIAL